MIRIFIALIISAIIIVEGVNTFDYRGRTFTDEKQFENLQQVQEYQTKIVNEAEKFGAKVNEFTLTIQSPPKVYWSVSMPQSVWSENPLNFSFGKRLESVNSAKIQSVVIILLFSIVPLATILFLIFGKNKKEVKNA